jgi:hypothetical protein
MSGPIRQQLADVTTVTPTLNDKAVTIQANTVRTSLYSAIYTLFKAGFDLIYATETYADNAAATAEANANNYTDIEVATKQDLFDYSGAATGTTAVTINSVKGGVATFTQTILPRKVQYFRINSDQITATSKIICTLVYDGAGYPLIANQKLAANRIDILVTNGDLLADGGATTNASIFIQYQIVG